MNTFQLRVESNLQLNWCSLERFSIECRKLSDMDWFRFTPLCDWSRQPVRCKTKTNYILVTRVFPRFLLWVFIGSLRVFSFLLIGRRCDNFGLVLQHSLKSALLHVLVGPGKLHHSLDQLGAKLKKTVICSHVFSRASGGVLGFSLRSSLHYLAWLANVLILKAWLNLIKSKSARAWVQRLEKVALVLRFVWSHCHIFIKIGSHCSLFISS